jgi:hypothetical protein
MSKEQYNLSKQTDYLKRTLMSIVTAQLYETCVL